MIIQNASAMGLDRQVNFFGDDVFRYKITKNISIEGYVLDLTNSLGVSGITSGIEAYTTAYTRDWEDIFINGVYFGSGYLDSLSFDPSIDVRTDQYQATFTVFEDGALNFPNDANYSGIQTGQYKFLDSLSETFTTNITQQKKSYSHNIDVRFITAADAVSITLAQQLASNLLNSADLTGFYWSGLSPYNLLYTENYNKITNKCAFTKNYELVDRTGYLFYRNHKFTFGNDGVTTVSETAEYRGKYNVFDSIMSDLRSDISSSFARCDAIYNDYNDDPNNNPLFDRQVIRNVTEIPREGYATYSVTYSDDIFFQSGAMWAYTNTINQDTNGVNQVSENGQIIGYGLIDDYTKQTNANSFWTNSVKAGIPTRLDSFYNVYYLSPTAESNIYLVNNSVSKNNRAGTVNYNSTYTDDPTRITTDGFKKVEKTCSNVERTYLSSNVIVPRLYELKQVSANFNVLPYSLAIHVVGNKTKTMDDYLTFAYNYIDFCTGDYIVSCDYSLDQFNNNFSLVVGTNGVICFG